MTKIKEIKIFGRGIIGVVALAMAISSIFGGTFVMNAGHEWLGITIVLVGVVLFGGKAISQTIDELYERLDEADPTGNAAEDSVQALLRTAEKNE